ncbi:MAG: zinc D-Ala-D-Ala carboxypeptidase [Myxococcota bacterium]|jgi:zinc D-Ala-D-Ala carboxypeptidase
MSRPANLIPFVGIGLFGLVTLIALTATGGSSMSSSAPLSHPIPAGQPGRYFTWAEFSKSGTASRLGLDNTPTPSAQTNLKLLCKHVLDPLRHHLGRAVRITSGFRSKAVNLKLKGASSTSQHMEGRAVDFKVEGISAEQLATIIVRLNLPFDQVIWYDLARGGHVHLSYTAARNNRRQMRHAPEGGGYNPWRPAAISGDTCG